MTLKVQQTEILTEIVRYDIEGTTNCILTEIVI